MIFLYQINKNNYITFINAEVAEMVDATDLKSVDH
jgi:hypothetical protein